MISTRAMLWLYVVALVVSVVDVVEAHDELQCSEGYLPDCGGEHCCPETWLGDGWADCEDAQWGCDLACYGCDGGDCPDCVGNITQKKKFCQQHILKKKKKIEQKINK